MKKLLSIVLLFVFAFTIQSCKSGKADNADEDILPEDAVTPVTITHPTHGNISETVELDATSAFRKKRSNTFHYRNQRSRCIRQHNKQFGHLASF